MRIISTLAVTLLAVAGVAPGAAHAQATDPDADSPSGVIYEIPLESARDDAAPRGGGSGGTQPGNGDGGTPASSVPADGGRGVVDPFRERVRLFQPGARRLRGGEREAGQRQLGGKKQSGCDAGESEAGGTTGDGTGDAAGEERSAPRTSARRRRPVVPYC